MSESHTPPVNGRFTAVDAHFYVYNAYIILHEVGYSSSRHVGVATEEGLSAELRCVGMAVLFRPHALTVPLSLRCALQTLPSGEIVCYTMGCTPVKELAAAWSAVTSLLYSYFYCTSIHSHHERAR